MLLTVSGASKTLDDIVKKMEPEMKEMNEKIYPSILDLEMIEEKWNHVRESYSEEQRKNIDEDGYAFLEPEQIQLLYSNQCLFFFEINDINLFFRWSSFEVGFRKIQYSYEGRKAKEN